MNDKDNVGNDLNILNQKNNFTIHIGQSYIHGVVIGMIYTIKNIVYLCKVNNKDIVENDSNI